MANIDLKLKKVNELDILSVINNTDEILIRPNATNIIKRISYNGVKEKLYNDINAKLVNNINETFVSNNEINSKIQNYLSSDTADVVINSKIDKHIVSSYTFSNKVDELISAYDYTDLSNSIKNSIGSYSSISNDITNQIDTILNEKKYCTIGNNNGDKFNELHLSSSTAVSATEVPIEVKTEDSKKYLIAKVPSVNTQQIEQIVINNLLSGNTLPGAISAVTEEYINDELSVIENDISELNYNMEEFISCIVDFDNEAETLIINGIADTFKKMMLTSIYPINSVYFTESSASTCPVSCDGTIWTKDEISVVNSFSTNTGTAITSIDESVNSVGDFLTNASLSCTKLYKWTRTE